MPWVIQWQMMSTFRIDFDYWTKTFWAVDVFSLSHLPLHYVCDEYIFHFNSIKYFVNKLRCWFIPAKWHWPGLHGILMTFQSTQSNARFWKKMFTISSKSSNNSFNWLKSFYSQALTINLLNLLFVWAPTKLKWLLNAGF